MDRAAIRFVFCQILFRCFFSSWGDASWARYGSAKQRADLSTASQLPLFGLDRGAVRRMLVPSLLCALFLCWAPSLAAQQVVVNHNVPLQFVAKPTLRAIFGMRLRNWPDNTPITVFVLANDEPVHIAFCKDVLNMFPHQLQRAWDRLVYSGTGQAPIVVSSLQEMAEKVGTTPGAVGYLDRVFIDGRVHALNIR